MLYLLITVIIDTNKQIENTNLTNQINIDFILIFLYDVIYTKV